MGFGLGSLNPVRIASNVVSTAKDVKDKAVDTVSSVGSAVTDVAKGTAALVGDTAKAAGSVVTDTAKAATSALGSTAQAAGSAITDTAKAAGDVLGSATSAVGDVAKSAGDAVVDVVKGAGDVVTGTVKGAGGAVEDAAKGIGNFAKTDAGKAALAGAALYFAPEFGFTGGLGANSSAAATAAGEGAVTSPVLSGAVEETALGQIGEAAATGAAGVPVVDAVATPVSQIGTDVLTKEQLASVAAINGVGGMSATDALLYGAGGAVAATEGIKAIANSITPEVVTESPSSTSGTSSLIDMTLGEKRASSQDMADIQDFQARASQRSRTRGASILAGNAARGAVGTYQLTGA